LNCYPGFTGPICDQRCIDANCSIICQCFDTCESSEVICFNNVTINITTIISNSTTINGTLIIINGSQVDLNSSQLVIFENVTLNASILFSGLSSITSKECITLNNVNFTLDLSHTSSNQGKLLLLNSTAGCLNGTYEISYLNKPKCTNLISEKDASSLYIIFVQDTACEERLSQSPLANWIIAVIIIGSVIGLAIIVAVIIFTVPSLRKKILPHEKGRNMKQEKEVIKNDQI